MEKKLIELAFSISTPGRPSDTALYLFNPWDYPNQTMTTYVNNVTHAPDQYPPAFSP
jgi:hypothetical protein